MEQYRAHMNLLGRILLAMIFLMSGVHKILDLQGTQQFMMSMGMTTATGFFYIGAVVIELAGGFSLLLGYMTRMGAMLLVLFMIPTTLIFHTQFSDPNQMIHFLKNLAMCGGLLFVMTYGPGRLSLDGRMAPAVIEDSILIAGEEQRRRLGATGS